MEMLCCAVYNADKKCIDLVPYLELKEGETPTKEEEKAALEKALQEYEKEKNGHQKAPVQG